ncbi:MAG: reverse transcriptase domain-containing protein [Phenylobacterium sp.]|nr:reverse transcriptase domain-containing protein [Phenylobacterium sp.]
MAKKYRNLIGPICSPDNMRAALARTARGKRMSQSYLEFKEFAEVELEALAADMASGAYRPDPPHVFTVFEPKVRLISAQSFRDRVAQQALVAIIGPIFEATLLPRAFACRAGLGVHAGVRAVQSELRRPGAPRFALKTDFAAYFRTIDRARLWGLIERKITCAATADLIAAMVPRTGQGLPIGSLTSQLFANVYAGQADRYLQCERGQRRWYRYMDDIVVLGDDPVALHALRRDLEAFVRDRLGLSFSRWSVQPVARGVNFLGYRIWPRHKLLRRQSVIRAKRVIRTLTARGDHARLDRFLGAWIGHARWADSHNLLSSLHIEDRHVAH